MTHELLESTIEGTIDRTANFRPDLQGKRPIKKDVSVMLGDILGTPCIGSRCLSPMLQYM